MTDTPFDQAAFLERTAIQEPTDPVEAALGRLRDFSIRAAGGVAFTSSELFNDFCRDLVEEARSTERSRTRGKEPEVWSASEELAAVKYAREQGYVTALEAQRKVRKLLRLKGRRTLADAAATRRRATPATRRRTAR